jgi:hypothetical protein
VIPVVLFTFTVAIVIVALCAIRGTAAESRAEILRAVGETIWPLAPMRTQVSPGSHLHSSRMKNRFVGRARPLVRS